MIVSLPGAIVGFSISEPSEELIGTLVTVPLKDGLKVVAKVAERTVGLAVPAVTDVGFCVGTAVFCRVVGLAKGVTVTAFAVPSVG